MKIYRILCVALAIILPQLALAKLPFPNDAFGRVEATLDSCAQADPPSASKYQEAKKALVKDVPEKEVAEARASQEYRDAYDATTTEIGKQPKDKVVEACTASLKSDK
ncbi:MAG TPA: hypothetical protein VEV41_08825 [Terriglobales bacterium]|nr:hypothetical protein [Terriglobales bacterium]